MYLAILFLPIFGSIVSGFLGRKIGVTGAHIIATSSLLISAFLCTIAFYEVALKGYPVTVHVATWIDSELMEVS